MQRIFEQFDLESEKGQNTPMDDNVRLMKYIEPFMEPYHEAVGCLMYLIVGTRPDLEYSVYKLAKFVEHPTVIHWVAVSRVFRYILSTKHCGLR